jgi:hypothetical protein
VSETIVVRHVVVNRKRYREVQKNCTSRKKLISLIQNWRQGIIYCPGGLYYRRRDSSYLSLVRPPAVVGNRDQSHDPQQLTPSCYFHRIQQHIVPCLYQFWGHFLPGLFHFVRA